MSTAELKGTDKLTT